MGIRKADVIKKLKFVVTLFFIAYFLNLVWENVQKPLFTGFEAFWKSGLTCYSAAFGDALIILGIYFLIALMRGKYYWFRIRTKDEIVLLLIFGFIVAVLFEKFALATGRWGYAASMPVVPFLNVGIIPILQMLILPFFSIKITNKIIN